MSTMRVDFDQMASELGLRPDALRIEVGRPTRLQREMEKTQDFSEIASFASKFSNPYSSCGIQFEPEEKRVYEQIRYRHFSVMLKKLTAIPWPLWRRHSIPWYSFTEAEVKHVVTEFLKLFMEGANEIRTLNQCRKYLRKLKKFNENLPRNFSTVDAWIHINAKEKEIVAEEIRSATTLEDRLALVQKYSQVTKAAYWDFIWEPFDLSIEDIKSITSSTPSDRLNHEYFAGKLKPLVAKKMGELDGFEVKFEFSLSLSTRDNLSHEKDPIFSMALGIAMNAAVNAGQCLMVIEEWRKRGIELPPRFVEKYNSYFIEKISTSEDVDYLRRLGKSSPHHSLRFRAEDRIRVLLTFQLDTLDDLEEREAFRKANPEAMSLGLERDEEMRKALLYSIFDNVDATKQQLIEAFHSFRQLKDHDAARRVLLRLISYFPAEDVDEVPIEVLQ